MSAEAIEQLIARAKAGTLTPVEQHEIACELEYYRGAALRLERCVNIARAAIARAEN